MWSDSKDLINDLIESNKDFIIQYQNIFKKFVKGQNPKLAILTCSDSRVIPEKIFNKSIGEIFVVRVAGNIAMDNSVLSSLEYAVNHLKVNMIIILGHTNCGAVNAAENTKDTTNSLLNEIKNSFSIDKNHILANIIYQLNQLPNRSKIISNALKNKTLDLVGAIYYIENGNVEFL